MPESKPIGVLLMAYGGPGSLEDIPGYLADIRAGRPTPRGVLEEISRNYEAIGGKSPLLEHTTRQATGLEHALGENGRGEFRIYLGMRHWAPWIEDAVRGMLEDGITRAVSLVLAPHFSGLSVAKYHERIDDGLSFHRGTIDFEHIDSYHDAPGLIDALATRVADGLSRFDEEERRSAHVIFSAHSLPARISASGDPYDRQAKETAALVALRAGLRRESWSWSYQSAGRSAEPWLGPALLDHISSLAEQGVRSLVSVPVGFVSDHVEILYDIDIDARAHASSLGMRLERPPSLNDDPVFIREIARLVRARAAVAGWM